MNENFRENFYFIKIFWDNFVDKIVGSSLRDDKRRG